MNILDRRTASVLTTTLIFAIAALVLYGTRKILVVFLFAIFFAYLLYPLVLFVQRRSKLSRDSRDRAILQVYLVLLICFAGILLGIGSRLIDEGRRLGAAMPGLIDTFTSGQIAWTIGGNRGWSYETQLRIQQFLLLSKAIWLVLIPILASFPLRDGQEIAEQAIRMGDMARERVFMRGIVDDMNEMLAGDIRAQLLLAGLSLVVYTGILLILRLP